MRSEALICAAEIDGVPVTVIGYAAAQGSGSDATWAELLETANHKKKRPSNKLGRFA